MLKKCSAYGSIKEIIVTENGAAFYDKLYNMLCMIFSKKTLTESSSEGVKAKQTHKCEWMLHLGFHR